MKILYLRLLNSAGIWAAMSRTEIALDFSKTDKNIIMLFGENGSGKTTILSSLHPFVGSTNDERKKFFLEGVEGEKEIHYKVDDDVYIIRHYVKKSTKSYISKISYKDYVKQTKKVNPSEVTGEELNENGGVRTFGEVIKMTLGVTEDYFKISRIGTNVSNFINLSTAERKKYITIFLPNIEEYLVYFKVASEKAKLINKEIKFVSDQITKIGNIDELNETSKQYQEELDENNGLLDDAKAKVANLKGKIAVIDGDGKLSDNGYSNWYEDEFNDALKQLEKAKKTIEGIDLDEDELSKKCDSLREKQTKCEIKINKYTDKIESIKSDIADTLESRDSKVKDLQGLDYEDIESLNDTKDKIQDEINEIQGEIDSLDMSRFYLENLDDVSADNVSTFIVFINEIIGIKLKLSDENMKHLNKIYKKEEIDLETFQQSVDETLSELHQLEEELESKKLEKINLTGLAEREELLNEQRPEGCKIDSCVFLEDLNKCKGASKKLETVTQESKELEDKLEQTSILYETANAVVHIIKEFKSSYLKAVSVSLKMTDILKNYNVKGFESFISNIILGDYNISKDFSVSEILTYKTAVANQQRLQAELDSIENKINSNSKISTVSKKIQKEIDELEEKYSALDESLHDYTSKLKESKEELKETEDSLNECLSNISALENISKYEEEYKEIEEKYNNVKSRLDNLAEIAEELQEAREEVKTWNKTVASTTEKLDSLKYKIMQYYDFEDRKTKLEDSYEKITYVKEANDPTKGIPIYFINDYLNKTQEIANDLLGLSQHGRFAIKFDVDDKDFYIRVYKSNGDVLTDINEASQGESALANVSLSLALIEQSTYKYNIVLYDEVDGALDVKNRRNFIDMIETQREKIGGEQIFVISHNNEFDNCEIGMVLLNENNINTADSEFMSNKDIIFTV
jgi:DNA repair exonuclease SbcCD ATPase subunit